MEREGKSSTSNPPLGSGERSLSNPSLRLTSVTLDGTNYLVWSRSFILAITAQGMLGFLTGDNKRPSSGPEFTTWCEKNALVMTWLINSIQPTISRTFVLMDSAHEIWSAAAQLYSQQGNDAQAYELRKKIRGFYQKDQSLAEYYAELSGLWQELDYY